jgi:hypothetical protein
MMHPYNIQDNYMLQRGLYRNNLYRYTGSGTLRTLHEVYFLVSTLLHLISVITIAISESAGNEIFTFFVASWAGTFDRLYVAGTA